MQTSLNRVVYNPLFSDRFIATESGNPGHIVLITLERFNLKRIPLNINLSTIEPCPQGYLLSDSGGRIILLNSEIESQSYVFLQNKLQNKCIEKKRRHIFTLTLRKDD